MKNVDITEQLENIQEEIINAGGCFMKQSRLKRMSVEELLEICVCNHIDFNIKHNMVEHNKIKTGMEEIDNRMKDRIKFDYLYDFFTGNKLP